MIFCVGRNYAAHVREMSAPGAPAPAPAAEPVVFLKPPQARVDPPGPIVLPAGAGEIHHEVEVVVRVDGAGRAEALALGLDLTDRTRQAEAKQKGLPWAAAKGFRGSAPLGPFVPLARAGDLARLRFALHVNGALRQQGSTADMLVPVPELLAYLQRWFGLAAGDLVFTGTPEGVGPLRAGDVLDLRLEGVPEASARFSVAAAPPARA